MRVVYAFFPVPNGRVKLWSWASACVEYKSLSYAHSSWDSQGTVPMSLHNSENPSVPDAPWLEAWPSWVVRAFYLGEVEDTLSALGCAKYSQAWAVPSLCTCLRSLDELTDLQKGASFMCELRASCQCVVKWWGKAAVLQELFLFSVTLGVGPFNPTWLSFYLFRV